MLYSDTYVSPLGNIRLYSDGTALIGLYTEFWQKRQKNDHNAEYGKGGHLSEIIETKRWLDIYFQGKEPDFLPPLKPSGSAFRQKVWNILSTIPYGKLTTYGEIAAQFTEENGGKPMSAQAIGGAVGANPIGIIIPCHRVIGRNGCLTGYAGGLETKLRLLKLEHIDTDGLFMPKQSRFL